MFTGLVEERGIVKRARSAPGLLTLEIRAHSVARELDQGDSVAVNGVCLSAVATKGKHFTVEVMQESMARSTLGDLERGDSVNLELPVRLADRLGGHLVQGHVDGTAEVTRVEEDAGASRVWFRAADGLLHYMVPKGSVTIDGVSLTVVDVDEHSFEIALIPHTRRTTTLGSIRTGSNVNVEVDAIAKYVDALLERSGVETREQTDTSGYEEAR